VIIQYPKRFNGLYLLSAIKPKAAVSNGNIQFLEEYDKGKVVTVLK
jgi:hypothetical protein